MDEKRYGILIASSLFPDEPKLETLRCPMNDIDGLKKVLSSKDYGQFSELIELKNEGYDTTKRKIYEVLGKAEKDDLVLIYYSGHGKLDLDGQLCLAMTNTIVSMLDITSISIETIKKAIKHSQSQKVILILDCCYSGAAGNSFVKGGFDDQLQIMSSEGKGIYIMTASTGIQVAKEKESDQYGIFTKHLIEGIKSGKADLDGDGLITINELYDYVHKQVVNEEFQEPMRWNLNVKGNSLVIARSGRKPRKERAKKIRKILLTLRNKDLLPKAIWKKADDVLDMKPANMSEECLRYDELLGQLLEGIIDIGEFIDKWYAVKPAEEQKKERFLDAAIPEHVVIGEQVELLTMIRLPNSEGLKKVLKDNSFFQTEPESVQSEKFDLYFPVNEIGNITSVELLLRIETDDFDFIGKNYERIKIYPSKDSIHCSFRLNPRKKGSLTIVIKVYLTRTLVASGWLKVCGHTKLEGKIDKIRALITFPIGTFGIGSKYEDMISPICKARLPQNKVLDMIPMQESLQKEAPNASSTKSFHRPAMDKAITAIDENIFITWIRVPAGSFRRGCPNEFMRHIEKTYNVQADVFRTYPEREESLEDFWMSLTPITNAQFYSFVKATGHRYPSGWRGILPPYPQGDADKPVTLVTWQDSMAFAVWLGARLPTRAEYEKACRGENGFLYPWGNIFDKSRCNTDESHIGQLTCVSTFPAGASVYGILDLVGNVWEWAADTEEKKFRMTVGGSYETTGEIYGVGFFDVSRSPESSENDLGFRIACSDIRKLNIKNLEFTNDSNSQ